MTTERTWEISDIDGSNKRTVTLVQYRAAQTNEIILADMDDWHTFAMENLVAIQEQYGSVANAYQHAIQGGLTFGGGAAPLTTVTFAD